MLQIQSNQISEERVCGVFLRDISVDPIWSQGNPPWGHDPMVEKHWSIRFDVQTTPEQMVWMFRFLENVLVWLCCAQTKLTYSAVSAVKIWTTSHKFFRDIDIPQQLDIELESGTANCISQEMAASAARKHIPVLEAAATSKSVIQRDNRLAAAGTEWQLLVPDWAAPALWHHYTNVILQPVPLRRLHPPLSQERPPSLLVTDSCCASLCQGFIAAFPNLFESLHLFYIRKIPQHTIQTDMSLKLYLMKCRGVLVSVFSHTLDMKPGPV